MINLPDNQPCPHCGRFRNRRITIDAVIIKDGKILLIRRGVEPFKNMWALPGGGIEFNETAEDAIRKEVKEEVGLEVKTSKFLQAYTDLKRDPNQAITLSYLIDTEGEPKAGSDAASCQFFSLDNLPSEIALDHRKIIQDALKLA